MADHCSGAKLPRAVKQERKEDEGADIPKLEDESKGGFIQEERLA